MLAEPNYQLSDWIEWHASWAKLAGSSDWMVQHASRGKRTAFWLDGVTCRWNLWSVLIGWHNLKVEWEECSDWMAQPVCGKWGVFSLNGVTFRWNGRNVLIGWRISCRWNGRSLPSWWPPSWGRGRRRQSTRRFSGSSVRMTKVSCFKNFHVFWQIK